MRTGHPAVMPSAITEAGKTARGWIEEQVRSNKNCGSKSGLKFWLFVSNLFATPALEDVLDCKLERE
ncbi:unnamed protein product, partial [Staurois parvus]